VTAPLFQTHVIVDWSAAGSPRSGRDSIWIAAFSEGRLTLENPSTRAEAEERLAALLASETAAGRRAMIGFDFPFGYPRGLSQAIRAGGDWRDVWSEIARTVVEGPANASNRFHAAAEINVLFQGEGPFWGNGLKDDIIGLPRTKPLGWGAHLPHNRRAAESAARGAQEVWKLSGAGSVGSQALTGIAMLERLRRRQSLAIWPFEKVGGGHVAAEVYPSLVPVAVGAGEIRDARQVEVLARAFAAADAEGLLAAMLAAPLDPEQLSDEATMLGLSHLDRLRALAADTGPGAAPPTVSPSRPRMRPYLKDPAAIYAASFATVRAEARLDRFPPALEPVVVRLIHACGMVEIADRLAFSPRAAEAGAEALLRGAPVFCDCSMVAAGITRLPPGCETVVTLDEPAVPGMARDLGTTRSAAAVEFWRDRIEGAIVAIGNAPTALFHLLERMDQGWPRPALILGFPVGFVGAAESKAELARDPRGAEFIALKGRRGGSAMAAAAVNALALA